MALKENEIWEHGLGSFLPDVDASRLRFVFFFFLVLLGV